MAAGFEGLPEKSSGDRLDALMESFAERRRRGERPSIEEYAAKHPDLADQIRALFPGLALIHDRPPETAGGEMAAVLAGPLPAAGEESRRLGEFRLLRVIGRGGMGIVYEAEQEPLKRKVALKVLPFHAHMEERFLERFRREAQAAAKLQHPGIVPVYGLGEEEGVPYYAMQFIDGLGLDKIVRGVKRLISKGGPPAAGGESESDDLSSTLAMSLITGRFEAGDLKPSGDSAAVREELKASPLRTPSAAAELAPAYYHGVARLGRQAAEALHCAHEAGILHRDIKPSNLLLDRQGRIWVTDFGLAKTEAGEDLTRTGEVLGTLRYMAPEQFRGRPERRSDVYSLGLTLYELAALEPAYAESDRGELVKRVLEGTPTLLRDRRPGLPRPLEAIVLKAIQKDPELRYATASELAEDLRRFLAGEPVLARRKRLLAGASRGARRRAGLAAAAALVALLFLAAWGIWQRSRPIDFQPAAGFSIGPSPETANSIAIAAADLNGDGGIDLVSANYDTGNLSLLFGSQNGAFTFSGTLAAGKNPADVIAADLDGDQDLDLAAANQKSRDFSVFLGDGQGSFAAGVKYGLEFEPGALASADLDRDGPLDLAVVGGTAAENRKVVILRNQGKGAFLPLGAYEVPGSPRGLAVADLNRDGSPDLAVTCWIANQLAVLLNDGRGRFRAGGTFPAGKMPLSVAAADFDGDREIDLAVACAESMEVRVLYREPDGGYGRTISLAVPSGTSGLAAADLDLDGLLDLAASSEESRTVEVALNHGNGAFAPPISFPAGGLAIRLLAADLDGDKRIDLACANGNTNQVGVLWNQSRRRN
ncbi:MAG: VCBS repeat-containing protein [Planctomycetes bacterium]|nr:VCBS repeat-containing protein [Planctomycetota bacterium]